MARGAVPYPRQLQRNGLTILLVGVFATVVLAVLHGGLDWINIGPFFMVAGAIMALIGRMLQARARSAEADARRR